MEARLMRCDTTGTRWDEAVRLLADAEYRVAGIEVTRPQGSNPSERATWRVLRQVECEPGYLRITLARECGYEGRALISPEGG